VTTPPVDDAPIIVIDDDEAMRRACEATLRRAGHAVETFPDGPSGLQRIQKGDAGLIVVDLKMPGMSGMEVIARVKRIHPDPVIIVITGFATVGAAVEAMRAGAYDFIPKPFTAEELRVIISRGMERLRLAREARRLREEKEAQARRFVTFVSHQLQSPLGAVRQYLDVLCHQSGDAIPPPQQQWIERSREKINDMLDMIGGWLTIAKVEGGQFATERMPVLWQDVAPRVLESFAEAALENHVTLRNDVPTDLPPVVGDAPALKMLLANLVSNALKYNRPGGSVRIAAEVEGSFMALSVTDTGAGIAPEHHERVFEEFYRVPGGAACRGGGTGMGLPICKRIAEELGGRITLTSRPGEGSTFTVVLPRTPGEVSYTGGAGS